MHLKYIFKTHKKYVKVGKSDFGVLLLKSNKNAQKITLHVVADLAQS